MDPLDRICVLCMDEMSLKTNLFYNSSADIVIGLEDNGRTRTNKPASSVTVLMVKGIKSAWKQPIAYCFSATTNKATDMKMLLGMAVEQLTKIGLSVKCLITDMGSN